MTVLYGISNCDTVKKARKWLDGAGVAYRFHDFRVDGLDEDQVRSWIDEMGWESIVNRRSSTWRALDAATRDGMTAATAVREIMFAPTLIKRPLLDVGTKRHVGFNEAIYGKIFSGQP